MEHVPDDPEVPEADALEQERAAYPDDELEDEVADGVGPLPDDPEVPEADAIEQAQPAHLDDDFEQ